VQAGEFHSTSNQRRATLNTFQARVTQEVAYKALLVERRKPLHERAGHALGSMFAEQLEDHSRSVGSSLQPQR